jgi:hypothetical protein
VPATVSFIEILWIASSLLCLLAKLWLARKMWVGWKQVDNPCDEAKRPGIAAYAKGRFVVLSIFVACQLCFLFAGAEAALLPEPVTESYVERRDNQATALIIGNLLFSIAAIYDFWVHVRVPKPK